MTFLIVKSYAILYAKRLYKMNELTNRQSKILQEIYTHKQLKGSELAVLLDCSVRTIQNEINAINRKNKLIISSNQGYTIDEEQYVSICNFNEYPQKDHEALKILLFSNEPVHIYDLSDSLYVSVTTLEKQLKSYSQLLKDYSLILERHKGYLSISGDEINKRQLIKNLIINETNGNFMNIDSFSPYFDNIELANTKHFLEEIIQKHNYYIDPVYANTLTISLSVALYRMQTHHYIDSDVIYKSDESSIEFEIAVQVLNYYKYKYDLTPTKSDIQYISSLIAGQIKPYKISLTNSSKFIDEEFQNDIKNILNDAFENYMLDIDFSENIYSFSMHVDGLIKRSKAMQPAYNYAVKSLKADHPFIYEVAVYIANQISNQYSIKINDSEIGFICIYIGSLVENAIYRSKIHCLFVCENYHQIKDNLYNRLATLLPKYVKLECKDTNEFNASNYDLIITTDSSSKLSKNIIEISPFLTRQDFDKINKQIQTIANLHTLEKNQILFADFFSKDLFYVRDDFDDKYSLLDFLSNEMIKCGIANEHFTDSVIQREKLSSTSFGAKYAIPHAIELNSNKTMVSVLVSHKGIQWDQDNIVYIVLMIAVHKEDRNEFIELYENIIRSLENPYKISKLSSINSFKEFKDILLNNN